MDKKTTKTGSKNEPEKPDAEEPTPKSQGTTGANSGTRVAKQKGASKAPKPPKASGDTTALDGTSTGTASKKEPEANWWDAYEKREYRGKTYVFAFADLTPRLTDEQFVRFRTLVKRAGVIRDGVTVVKVGDVYIVVDGVNRLLAGIDLDLDIPLDVREGLTESEMRDLAYEQNYHRRHLDTEQMGEVIKGQLRKDAARTDNYIADDLGVSHNTVAKYRTELEAVGEIKWVEKRRDRQGKWHTATRKTPTQPAPAPKSAKNGNTPAPSKPRTEEPRADVTVEQPTADDASPASSGDGPSALFLSITGAIDALQPQVQQLVHVIRAGGSDAPGRADVQQLADRFSKFARDLTSTFDVSQDDGAEADKS